MNGDLTLAVSLACPCFMVFTHIVSLFEIVLMFACLVMSVTTVVKGQSMGSMAGWPTSKQVLSMNGNSPSCVSCNKCGPSIMFVIHIIALKMK